MRRGMRVPVFEDSLSKCVTLPTEKAEYVALADTIKEAFLLRCVWRFALAWSRIGTHHGCWGQQGGKAAGS